MLFRPASSWNTCYGLAFAVFAVMPVQAAPIIFGQPVTMAGDADVMNSGSLVYGFSESNLQTTVNGVAFAAGNSVSSLGNGSISMTGYGIMTNVLYGSATEAPYGSLSTDYKNLVKGGAWQSVANWNATITLNNLTSGRTYAPQLWLMDSRAFGFGRNARVTGANTVTLDYNTTDAVGGVGQYTRGWFTASGTSQSFTTFSATSNQLNAIQLRDVTGMGSWTGLGGAVWDQSSTANFTTNIDAAPLATGTYGALRDLLGVVVFGDTYAADGAAVAVTQNSLTTAPGGVGGGAVVFRNSAAVSYMVTSPDSQGINGTSSLWVDGGGVVTLAGPHSYTGGTSIRSGSLILTGPPAGGPISNAGTLTFDSAVDHTCSSFISGAGALVKSGSGTLTLTGTDTYTGATTVNAGKLRIGDGSAGTLSNGTASLAISSGAAVEFTASAFAIANRKVISGAGDVLFTGASNGTLAAAGLSSSNSGFSGTITANDVLLSVSGMGSVGTATLRLGGNCVLNVDSSGAFSAPIVFLETPVGEASITLNSTTMNGIVTLAHTARIGGIGTISGTLEETGGARALEWMAPDATTSITLTGINHCTGDTIIGGPSEISTVSSKITLNYVPNNISKLSDTGVLRLRGRSTIVVTGGSHLEVAGTGTVLEDGARANIYRTSGSSLLDLGLITRGAGASLVLGSTDPSTSQVVKTSNVPVSGNLGGWLTIGVFAPVLATTDGTGLVVPVTYTPVNTGSGTIIDGMDQVLLRGVAGPVGLGAEVTIDVNSLTGAGSQAVIDTTGKVLRLGASGAVLASSGELVFGASVNAGWLTAGGADDQPGTLDFSAAAANITVNSVIADNGGGVVSVSKLGASDLVLNGTNTYTGGSVFNGGTVRLNNNSAVGTGPVDVTGSTKFVSQTAAVLFNPVTLRKGAVLNLSADASEIFAVAGVTSGAGSIEKKGAGAVILSGANTYGGGTTVTAGTLKLLNTTGSATGSGAVTITGTSAKLSGTGSATGAVLVNGSATIEPGDGGIGKLKTGPFTLYTGHYVCSIQGTSADLIEVTGDFSLNGPLDLTAVNPTGVLVIATYTGVRSGTFSSVTGLPPGYAVSYNDAAKRVELAIVDSYLAWTSSKGMATGTTARNLNPDNDGLNNLGEFAFDGDPKSGLGDGKMVSKLAKLDGEDVLTLTVPVRGAASFVPSGMGLAATVETITYRIEGGGDPGASTQTVLEVTGSPAAALQASLNLPALSTGWTYRSFRLTPPVSQLPKGFLRARVTE